MFFRLIFVNLRYSVLSKEFLSYFTSAGGEKEKDDDDDHETDKDKIDEEKKKREARERRSRRTLK